MKLHSISGQPISLSFHGEMEKEVISRGQPEGHGPEWYGTYVGSFLEKNFIG